MEPDTEEAKLEDPEETRDIPPQLLFLHMVFNLFIFCRLYFQGLEDPKELHWHPQIQNVIVTTALDGIHIFKPANL